MAAFEGGASRICAGLLLSQYAAKVLHDFDTKCFRCTPKGLDHQINVQCHHPIGAHPAWQWQNASNKVIRQQRTSVDPAIPGGHRTGNEIRASTGRRLVLVRFENGKGTSSKVPDSNTVPGLIVAIVPNGGQ